jgi:hypothetical protein
MDKIIEWLTDKFQQPISLLLLLFGALLILLGVTTGFDLFGLQHVVPEDSRRWIALVLGVIFVGAAVLLYYLSPRSEKGLPDEFKENFLHRRANLSRQQKDLLDFIEASSGFEKLVSQEAIESEFSNQSLSETFYRLEHLRLLGFLEKQEVGNDRYIYRISAAYNRELGKKRPRAHRQSVRP